MIQVGEVVETKKGFKSNQTDDVSGDLLPLGSIEIRLGGYTSQGGQVRNVFAQPMFFNRRVPLIGEHVLVLNGPTTQQTSKEVKNSGYFYLSPINVTDDLTFHHLPKLWYRETSTPTRQSSPRMADKEIPGYTFPNPPKKVNNLQPFEGDDLYEGRFGQSLRFGSTVLGNTGVYEKSPTWIGSTNADPITILRVKKPTTPPQKRGWYEFAGRKIPKYHNPNTYTIEDISKDEASLYLTTTQKLSKFASGFKKSTKTLKIATYSQSQAILDASQVILNARKGKAFIIGKDGVHIAGDTIRLQSSKYNVDLDTLMDWLLDWWKQDYDLAKGLKFYSTAAGPTSVATNLPDFIKIGLAGPDNPLNYKFKNPAF